METNSPIEKNNLYKNPAKIKLKTCPAVMFANNLIPKEKALAR